MIANAVATDEWLAGIVPPKEIELLSSALDASLAHIFALKAGATMEETFGVLKLCIVHAVQVCNLGVPILEEELARMEGDRRQVTALESTPKGTGVRLAMSR